MRWQGFRSGIQEFTDPFWAGCPEHTLLSPWVHSPTLQMNGNTHVELAAPPSLLMQPTPQVSKGRAGIPRLPKEAPKNNPIVVQTPQETSMPTMLQPLPPDRKADLPPKQRLPKITLKQVGMHPRKTPQGREVRPQCSQGPLRPRLMDLIEQPTSR